MRKGIRLFRTHVKYMGRPLKIALLLLPVLMLTGCLERIDKGVDNNKVVASYGDAVLYEKNIKGIYPQGVSEEDSLKLLQAYADSWLRRQIKLKEAEKVLSDEGIDIEAKVADYRNSLLVRNLDQYYVDNLLDTLILPSDIEDFYRQHKADFILDRAIIKGRVVRVPNTFRQGEQLKTLMGSTAGDKQKDFLDMCEKNNLELTVYENWTDFRELLNHAPTTSGRDYDYMLPIRKIQELADTDNKYYIQITDALDKGDQAPLEWVENVVRRIIITMRSNGIIRATEDSLYNAAVNENKVIININQ